MTIISGAFSSFREVLARHIKQLAASHPERLGTEWFFLRYLRRLARRAENAERARELDGALRGLTRYYVDRVPEDSPLASAYEDILAAHREALRAEREY